MSTKILGAACLFVLSCLASGMTGAEPATGKAPVNERAADESAAKAPAPKNAIPSIDPSSLDTEAQAEERERRVNARVENARREARFNQLDVDGDGFLSEQELAAGDDVAASPEILDQDEDGQVSRSEFAALELRDAGGDTEWKAPQKVGKARLEKSGAEGEPDPGS